MQYVTLSSLGQITVPMEMRKALGLLPGKKVNISLNGDVIVIQKPEALDEVRRLIKAETAGQGTAGEGTESGAGWTAHVAERYGKS
jgi:AbrB family looped-hinge helix DNA binding protein